MSRQRYHHRLFTIVGEPITSLYNTEHDAWKSGEYQPDDVWNAAVDERNRRYDLYYRLVPLRNWGVS